MAYEYQPYPKWVNGQIVQTKEEHDALLAAPVETPAPAKNKGGRPRKEKPSEPQES